MNNYLKIFLLIFILSLSCNNDEVVNSNNNSEDYTTILRTDKFGMVLGGDTTDWCYTVPYEFSLQPAYPNPCPDILNINFQIGNEVLTKVFFKNNNDTLFLVNEIRAPGYYLLVIPKNNLGFQNQYKRLYMVADEFNCYGDVKFE